MEESWSENPSIVIPMIQANAKYEKKTIRASNSVDHIIKSLVSPKSAVTRYLVLKNVVVLKNLSFLFLPGPS